MAEESDNSKLEMMMDTYPMDLTPVEKQEIVNELLESELVMPVIITNNPMDSVDIEIGKKYVLGDDFRFKPIRLHNGNGQVILPLFTSHDKAFEKGSVNTMIMSTPQIQEILESIGFEFDLIVINPFDEGVIAFPTDTFIKLEKADIPADDLNQADDTDTSASERFIIALRNDSVELEHDIIVYYREEEPLMHAIAVNGIYTTPLPLPTSIFKEYNDEYPCINKLYIPKKTKALLLDINPKINHVVIFAPENHFKYMGRDDEGKYLWHWIGEDFY